MKIVRTWKLKSLTFMDEGRIVSHPFGRSVNGLVIYKETGCMSGIISNSTDKQDSPILQSKMITTKLSYSI